jgi:hypothetical protein
MITTHLDKAKQSVTTSDVLLVLKSLNLTMR